MTAAGPDGVTFVERAVHLHGPDALVVADLHVGRDATSNVTLPLGERADLLDRLRGLLDRFEPTEVVVAGDLLHSFEEVPRGARETVEEIADAVAAADATLTVTPGNHDAHLASVLDAPQTAEYEPSEGIVICHGHESPASDADLYVAGHEHPAIEVEGVRRPCFLFGPTGSGAGAGGSAAGAGRARDGGGTGTGSADVLVLPAFTRLAAGTPVKGLRSDTALSPLLAEPARFRPIVLVGGENGDETLSFPPLGDLRDAL